MTAQQRRKSILEILKKEKTSISASTLAEEFSVSRQIIVGDVALLRAQDHKIIATSRGYILEENLASTGYTATLVCFHEPHQTKDELYTIVDIGGTVLDVSIVHEVYGELVARLNISSRLEVDEFISKLAGSNAKLLTELTDGVHLHRVQCKDKETFQIIQQQLRDKNLLYVDDFMSS